MRHLACNVPFFVRGGNPVGRGPRSESVQPRRRCSSSALAPECQRRNCGERNGTGDTFDSPARPLKLATFKAHACAQVQVRAHSADAAVERDRPVGGCNGVVAAVSYVRNGLHCCQSIGSQLHAACSRASAGHCFAVGPLLGRIVRAPLEVIPARQQCSCATHPEYIWNVGAPSLQDTAASAASVLGVCRAHRPSEQQCSACRSADPVAHGGGRLRPRRLSGSLSRSAVAFTALAALPAVVTAEPTHTAGSVGNVDVIALIDSLSVSAREGLLGSLSSVGSARCRHLSRARKCLRRGRLRSLPPDRWSSSAYRHVRTVLQPLEARADHSMH